MAPQHCINVIIFFSIACFMRVLWKIIFLLQAICIPRPRYSLYDRRERVFCHVECWEEGFGVTYNLVYVNVIIVSCYDRLLSCIWDINIFLLKRLKSFWVPQCDFSKFKMNEKNNIRVRKMMENRCVQIYLKIFTPTDAICHFQIFTFFRRKN